MKLAPIKTTDDIRKLHGEMQQARNQQFLLGTVALTAFGLSSWLLPRDIQRHPEILPPIWALATIGLLVLLALFLNWSRTLWEVIVIMGHYLNQRGASEWERDFRRFLEVKRKGYRYRSQSRAVALVYVFLGFVAPTNYFVLVLIAGQPMNTASSWIVGSATYVYLCFALHTAFGPRRYKIIEEIWADVLLTSHSNSAGESSSDQTPKA